MELANWQEDQSLEKSENCEEESKNFATLDLVKQTKIKLSN